MDKQDQLTHTRIHNDGGVLRFANNKSDAPPKLLRNFVANFFGLCRLAVSIIAPLVVILVH